MTRRPAPVGALIDRRRELPGLALIVGFLLVGFDQLNGLAPLRTDAALAHGRAVLHLEHRLHVSPEASASTWLVAHHGLAVLANWSYNICQICVTSAVMGWLWWRHRDSWRPLRWVIVGTNALALLVFWLYPVAPPRLVAGSGVADSIAVVAVPFGWPAGIQAHEPGQFQALPSLHLAWASWVAYAIWTVERRRLLRWAAVCYPVFVGILVIVTGTHSLVDVAAGIASTAVLATAVTVLPRRAGPHRPPRSATVVGSPHGPPHLHRAPTGRHL